MRTNILKTPFKLLKKINNEEKLTAAVEKHKTNASRSRALLAAPFKVAEVYAGLPDKVKSVSETYNISLVEKNPKGISNLSFNFYPF